MAVAPYGCRGLVAGEQDERAFVIGVVEGPFQSGEDPGEHVAEPVEHVDAVGDQVGAVALGPVGSVVGHGDRLSRALQAQPVLRAGQGPARIRSNVVRVSKAAALKATAHVR